MDRTQNGQKPASRRCDFDGHDGCSHPAASSRAGSAAVSRRSRPSTASPSQTSPWSAVSRAIISRAIPAEDMALVIEVADFSLPRDRSHKARIYAAAAVPVYWIINLVDHQVEVYSNPTGPDARACLPLAARLPRWRTRTLDHRRTESGFDRRTGTTPLNPDEHSTISHGRSWAAMKGPSTESLGTRPRPRSAAGLSHSGRDIQVPWGLEGSLELVLPETPPFGQASFEIVWPETSGPLGDYAAALEAALDSPVGSHARAAGGSGLDSCHRRR